MTDAQSGAQKYTGNSNKDKTPEVEPEIEDKKVIAGAARERKKPLGRRIAENFTGADAQSVGQYILFEVVLPRFKDLIFDVGESALRRTLFGDGGSRGYTRGGSSGKGWTPYGSYSQGAVPKVVAGAPVVQDTASDTVNDIIVETRPEAENVMDKMGNLIETFGQANVADLKTAVGLTGKFTDEAWGWQTMAGTSIQRVGGANPGYVLVFPRPVRLP